MDVRVEFPEFLKAWQFHPQRFKRALRHETTEESPRKAELPESRHEPSHKIIVVAFGEDAHEVIVGTKETIGGDLCTAQDVARDNAVFFCGIVGIHLGIIVV